MNHKKLDGNDRVKCWKVQRQFQLIWLKELWKVSRYQVTTSLATLTVLSTHLKIVQEITIEMLIKFSSFVGFNFCSWISLISSSSWIWMIFELTIIRRYVWVWCIVKRGFTRFSQYSSNVVCCVYKFQVIVNVRVREKRKKV